MVQLAKSTNVTTQNLTEDERMAYLEYLDNKKWPYIYPVIIYLLILMLIGVVGNFIVLIVFTKRFKPSTNRLFILTLATFDLLTCTLSIPGVIVELRFHYTFFFPALCRIFRASRMYFVLVSMFTLAIVAVDRYRKVCHPLKGQYTIRSAGLAILAGNVVAIIFTVFGAVVGGRRTVKTDRDDVTGTNCSYDDEFIGKTITKFYSVAWFVTIFLCIAMFIIFYSLIGRTIWINRRFQFGPSPDKQSDDKQQAGRTNRNKSSNSYRVSDIHTEASNKIKTLSFSVSNKDVCLSQTGAVNAAKGNVTSAHGKPKSSGPPERSTSKTTFTLFVITVVFLLSFLPFVTFVAVWGSNWSIINGLHGYTFTVYKIFFHSYHVNSVVNCYIYCFFNPRFRRECKNVFCCRKDKKPNVQITLTESYRTHHSDQ